MKFLDNPKESLKRLSNRKGGTNTNLHKVAKPIAKKEKEEYPVNNILLPPTQEALKAHQQTILTITKRPARRQTVVEEEQKVYEGTYNIWYNKWTGQTNKGRFERGERAPSKINVQKDSGFTLADKRREKNPLHKAYFCLMFARGCCRKGHKCEFLHRIPLPLDIEEPTKDCFGRDRHRDEREDMNGVGSFNRENRSLYLGDINAYESSEGEKVLKRHFSQFGEIESVNVVPSKSIAFVKYFKRANAEFAKEAMEHQTLDAGEIVAVRWAYDDPNPKIIAEERRRFEKEFVEHFVVRRGTGDPSDKRITAPSYASGEINEEGEKYEYYRIS